MTAFVLLVRAPATARCAGVVWGCLLVQGRGLPAECGELAGARDCDGAARLAAPLAEVYPAPIKAALGAPGNLNDAGILAVLASSETLAEEGAVAVVVGGLDQEPPRVRWAGLGDLTLHALAVRGVLARHDTEESRQQRGLCKPPEVTHFRTQPRRGEGVHPAEAAKPCDGLCMAAVGHSLLEYADQCPAALSEVLHRG